MTTTACPTEDTGKGFLNICSVPSYLPSPKKIVYIILQVKYFLQQSEVNTEQGQLAIVSQPEAIPQLSKVNGYRHKASTFLVCYTEFPIA